MQAKEISNPSNDKAKRALKPKRLMNLDSKDFDAFDTRIKEYINETAVEREHRKELFSIATPDALMRDVFVSTLKDYAPSYLAVSATIGTIVLYYDESAEDMGTLSFICFILMMVLAFLLLFKAYTDFTKRVIYFGMFAYGAMIDFENDQPQYYKHTLMALTFTLAVMTINPSPKSPSFISTSLVQTLLFALLGQMFGIYSKHNALRKHEGNILFDKQGLREAPRACARSLQQDGGHSLDGCEDRTLQGAR